MAKHRHTILRHEKEVNRLHEAVHKSVKHREKSPSHHEAWLRAASNFRNHHSTVDDWIRDIEQSDISDWTDARDFTFQYLEIDPIYFRSGYIKETLIKKVKACDLTSKEAQILRKLIIGRIQSGALREFRKFCQLIPRIQNDAFVDEVETLAKTTGKDVANRATFAKQYFC